MTQPLWGIADIHAHFTANKGFGGHIFWGSSYGSLSEALAPCPDIHWTAEVMHGKYGYPDFDTWPDFTTLSHQQAHVEWIKRAYQGGLRLVSCLCVNSEFMPRILHEKLGFKSPLPYDDKSVTEAQIAELQALVDWVAQFDGGWMQIAYTPEQARDIVRADKLAVIIGIEVEAIGNWHTPAELRDAAQQAGITERELISRELDRLYGLGVRQITPIHIINNPFGGAAVYNILFQTPNELFTGKTMDIEDGWESGIRYRIDYDDPTESRLADLGLQLFGFQGSSTANPKSTFRQHLRKLRSHRNALGLTDYGVILIEEMIKRGMLIDLDHMSDKSRDKTLEIAVKMRYPVIFTHTRFRELLYSADIPFNEETGQEVYGIDNAESLTAEGQSRPSDLQRVRELGGIIAPILSQTDILDFDGPNGIRPSARTTVDNDCSGSSKSWAQAYLYAVQVMGGTGVALGSDVNGFAGLPGPRFGTFGAHSLGADHYRDPKGKLRVQQLSQQRNGVRYTTPLRNNDAWRFAGDAYDGDGNADLNRDLWQALAMFKGSALDSEGDRARRVAEGMMAGTLRETPADELREANLEWLAGYWAGSSGTPPNRSQRYAMEVYRKLTHYMDRWREMGEGSETPIERSVAGNREFDYNIDGFAHYGMLLDFLIDLKNIGLTDQHLDPLYHSAESYVQTWERCIERSQAQRR